MKRTRFQAVHHPGRQYYSLAWQFLTALCLLGGLAACGNKSDETAFNEEPKGYVEFYMTESKVGEENIGVDTQVYRIENGQRVFLGMTRKWGGLAEPRRGLTIASAPGEQAFVIVHDSAQAAVKVRVEEGGYHRVRIVMTGLAYQEMIGTTRQLRFGLQAAVEPSK